MTNPPVVDWRDLRSVVARHDVNVTRGNSLHVDGVVRHVPEGQIDFSARVDGQVDRLVNPFRASRDSTSARVADAQVATDGIRGGHRRRLEELPRLSIL